MRREETAERVIRDRDSWHGRRAFATYYIYTCIHKAICVANVRAVARDSRMAYVYSSRNLRDKFEGSQ